MNKLEEFLTEFFADKADGHPYNFGYHAAFESTANHLNANIANTNRLLGTSVFSFGSVLNGVSSSVEVNIPSHLIKDFLKTFFTNTHPLLVNCKPVEIKPEEVEDFYKTIIEKISQSPMMEVMTPEKRKTIMARAVYSRLQNNLKEKELTPKVKI